MTAGTKLARTTKERARVFLVDDHVVVRSGLAQLIDRQPDLKVCGEADDASGALSALSGLGAQIAVVDISLRKDVSGLDLIRAMSHQFPNVAVLVLSMYDEAIFAERALRAGAKGYVMKAEPPETLLRAIRAVLRGEIHLSAALAQRIVSRAVRGTSRFPAQPVERLTDRELEVLRCLGQGLAVGRIAAKLHLSVKTVETYRVRIRDKLALPDAAALLEYAVEWVRGLESP